MCINLSDPSLLQLICLQIANSSLFSFQIWHLHSGETFFLFSVNNINMLITWIQFKVQKLWTVPGWQCRLPSQSLIDSKLNWWNWQWWLVLVGDGGNYERLQYHSDLSRMRTRHATERLTSCLRKDQLRSKTLHRLISVSCLEGSFMPCALKFYIQPCLRHWISVIFKVQCHWKW